MLKQKSLSRNFISFLLVALLLVGVIFPCLEITTSAATLYSDVMTDLQIDPNFNPGHYSFNENEHKIEVIQIAESTSGELFVYTYQPNYSETHYKANYLNMALQSVTDQNLTYKLYSLEWLSNEGVFCKYVVKDFKVSTDTYRYYNIAGIYRPYDKNIDDSSSSEAIDTVQCKGYPVGQVWCAYYYNSILNYEMETIEYTDITVHSTGTVRYYDGFSILFGATMTECDAHYVAFSVKNFKIDKIYDADITYTTIPQTYIFNKNTGTGTTTTDSDNIQTVNKTLSEFDTGSNEGTGLFGKKYEWNRISTAADFISDVKADSNDNFSQSELEALENSDFVFRFLETEYVQDNGYQIIVTTSTKVEKIGILRLHFLSEGKVYNLGCIGDLVGTDSTPDMEVTIGDNIQNSLEENPLLALILFVVILLLLINLIAPIKAIFNLIVTAISFLISVIFGIIKLPFRILQKK